MKLSLRVAITMAFLPLVFSAPSQAGLSECQRASIYADYAQAYADAVCAFTDDSPCIDARWDAITAGWYADEKCGNVARDSQGAN